MLWIMLLAFNGKKPVLAACCSISAAGVLSCLSGVVIDCMVLAGMALLDFIKERKANLLPLILTGVPGGSMIAYQVGGNDMGSCVCELECAECDTSHRMVGFPVVFFAGFGAGSDRDDPCTKRSPEGKGSDSRCVAGGGCAVDLAASAFAAAIHSGFVHSSGGIGGFWLQDYYGQVQDFVSTVL